MARRLTRKQIKHDEFVTIVDRATRWMGSNWRQAAMGFAGAVVLALAWWGASAFFGARASAAAEALQKGIEAYGAPVGAASTASSTVTFATDSQRLDAAQKAFDRVASRYWLTPQARLARLYLAHIKADRGDVDGAIRALSGLAAKRSADPIVRMAMLDLVHLRMAKHQDQELVPELQAMAEGKDPRLPRDAAMFLLAEVLGRTGKQADATRFYKQLMQDFPDSPYRYEAQQRLTAEN